MCPIYSAKYFICSKTIAIKGSLPKYIPILCAEKKRQTRFPDAHHKSCAGHILPPFVEQGYAEVTFKFIEKNFERGILLIHVFEKNFLINSSKFRKRKLMILSVG